MSYPDKSLEISSGNEFKESVILEQVDKPSNYGTPAQHCQTYRDDKSANLVPYVQPVVSDYSKMSEPKTAKYISTTRELMPSYGPQFGQKIESSYSLSTKNQQSRPIRSEYRSQVDQNEFLKKKHSQAVSNAHKPMISHHVRRKSHATTQRSDQLYEYSRKPRYVHHLIKI